MIEWKRHRGSKSMPKRLDGKLVEIRYRNGAVCTGSRMNAWDHEGSDSDIMAYRILSDIDAPDYTNGYPENTTAADIGAKVGDEFLMIDDAHHGADLGEKVILAEDDGTRSPFFTNSRGLKHCISWIFLSPVPPKSAIELQEEEVGIPEQEWPEDRVDVVGQNGNDGLHYDDTHLGIKRPDGEGWVKYNAGDVVNIDDVDSIDWFSASGSCNTTVTPECLQWNDGSADQIAWYRLCYEQKIDTSPERVEIEAESVRIPTEERIKQLYAHADSALKAFDRGSAPATAPDFLQSALQTITQRGKDYDKPEGERSASAVAVAFNAITGRSITEAEVWLVLQLVKDVRQWQNPGRYHADSALDCVAYAALKAEALAKGGE